MSLAPSPCTRVAVARARDGCPAPGPCRGGRPAARRRVAPGRRARSRRRGRAPRAAGAQRRSDVRGERRLVARLRRDVDSSSVRAASRSPRLGVARRSGLYRCGSCATAGSTSRRQGLGNQQLCTLHERRGARGDRARGDVLRARRRRGGGGTILGFGGEAVVGDRRAVRAGGSTCWRRARRCATCSACPTAATSACACATRCCSAAACRSTRCRPPTRRWPGGSRGWTVGFALFDALDAARPSSARRAAGALEGPVGDGGDALRARVRDLPRRVFCALLGHRPSPEADAVGTAAADRRAAAARASSTTTAGSGTARSTSSTPARRPTPPTRWPTARDRGSATRARESSSCPSRELAERYEQLPPPARSRLAGHSA